MISVSGLRRISDRVQGSPSSLIHSVRRVRAVSEMVASAVGGDGGASCEVSMGVMGSWVCMSNVIFLRNGKWFCGMGNAWRVGMRVLRYEADNVVMRNRKREQQRLEQ